MSWDANSNRMTVNPSIYRNVTNFFLYFDLTVMGGRMAYKLWSQLSSSTKNDILDTGYTHSKQSYSEGLQATIYVMFISTFILIVCAGVRVRQQRHQLTQFVNMMIENCQKYQDLYKEQIRTFPGMKKFIFLTDLPLLIMGLGTAIVPILFSFTVLQKGSPFYNMLTEDLELTVKLSWRIVPLMLLAYYFSIQAADVVFLLDTPGILLFCCSNIWLTLLEPVSITVRQGVVNFTCKLGCTLELDQLRQLYRERQILFRWLNAFYAHILITVHHAALLVICTLACYQLIRHYEFLVIPGYQLIPLAILGAVGFEYVETILIVHGYTRSKTFVNSFKTLAQRERKWTRKIQKDFATMMPLQGQLAYPYFSINMDNFLNFGNAVIDLLVNCLVS
ncbi:unnamed protein product [Orchesella dallaii]|uniref:Gustatory receptor n=1 Tax=Orchesella dallaii TaxID=48710 RepID=A0ABP1Q758_9HEXA